MIGKDKMKGLWISLIFCIVVVFAANGVAQKHVDGNDIVKKMTEAYGSTKSFRGAGTGTFPANMQAFAGKQVEEIIVADYPTKTKNVSFEINFVRPGKFRFEWTNQGVKTDRPWIFWSDGKGTFSWRSSDTDISTYVLGTVPDAGWAISDATMGSMGVGPIMLDTLNGSKESFGFSKMTNARLVREERVGGRACYVIYGFIMGQPHALWIEKGTYALRRYRVLYAASGLHESVEKGKMETVIGEVTFDSADLGVMISDSVFNFEPTLRDGDFDSRPKEGDIFHLPPLPPGPKSLPTKPDQ